MMTVPPAHLSVCSYCGAQLDTRDPTVYQFLSGWARNQNKGNSVTLAKRVHRWACMHCVERLQDGIPLGQMGLWDG